MIYYDISPLISENTAVFPGDQPYKRTVHCDVANGDGYTTSSLLTTVHLGAHTDAPNHYAADGKGIDERNLDYYLGKCQVISVTAKPTPYRLTLADVEQVEIKAPRVLFHTGSFPNPDQWCDNFTALSAELIHHLAKNFVSLVGIDTPSVDPAEDKTLQSHHAINEHNMAILEGIVLTNVPDGIYTLISLPLKLKDADASPVRAILLPENNII